MTDSEENCPRKGLAANQMLTRLYIIGVINLDHLKTSTVQKKSHPFRKPSIVAVTETDNRRETPEW
jgi:hypothetical protein